MSSIPTGEFEQALINRPISAIFYGLRTGESWFAFPHPPPTPFAITLCRDFGGGVSGVLEIYIRCPGI
jgi:hypothetical protein